MAKFRVMYTMVIEQDIEWPDDELDGLNYDNMLLNCDVDEARRGASGGGADADAATPDAPAETRQQLQRAWEVACGAPLYAEHWYVF